MVENEVEDSEMYGSGRCCNNKARNDKNKGRRALPKGFLVGGELIKSATGRRGVQAAARDGDGKLDRRLLNGAHGACRTDVSYSLDKDRRWSRVRQLRHIADSQLPNEHVRVSLLECYEMPGRQSRRFQRSVRSYYTVEETGNEVCRAAKAYTAQERTLTEKAHPKRQRRNNRRLRHISPPLDEQVSRTTDETQDALHIRYEVLETPPSLNLYNKVRRKCCRRIWNIPRPWKRPAEKRLDRTEIAEGGKFRDQSALSSDVELEDSVSSYCNSGPPETTFNLGDIEITNRQKRSRKKKKNRRNSVSDCSGSSVSASWDRLFDDDDRPWLRQLSHLSGASTLNSNPGAVLDDILNLEEITDCDDYQLFVNIDDEQLTSEHLKETYGHQYYECRCIPRRFVIDVSEHVRNVMIVAHGRDATMAKRVQVFICAQVSAFADDVRLTFPPMARSVEGCRNVRFWVNGLFVDSFRSCWITPRQEGSDVESLASLLRHYVVNLGTMPLDVFKCDTLSTSTDLELRQNAESEPMSSNVSLHDLLPSDTLPHTRCLHTDDELTRVALAECHLAPKLQRQLTAIAAYHQESAYPWRRWDAWLLDLDGDCQQDEHRCCNICYEEPMEGEANRLCLAECRHWFCVDCWRAHCRQQLRTGLAPITCPAGDCDSVVDYDTFTSLMSISDCATYAALLSQWHLLQNRAAWAYCPSQSCRKVLKVERSNVVGILKCHCGETWCFSCSEAVHWPVACEHAKLYNKQLKDNGDDLSVTQLRGSNTQHFVDVKRCPKCETPMEKGFGCNHMVCRCGTEFCWSCTNYWDGGRHYNCSLESRHGIESLHLRDVKRPNRMMDEQFYVLCVKHRRAVEEHSMRLLRHAVTSASRKNTKLDTGTDFTRTTVKPIDIPMIYQRAHSCLEHVYCWVSFGQRVYRRQKDAQFHDQLTVVKQMADRLSFTVDRVYDQCLQPPVSVDRVIRLAIKCQLLTKALMRVLLAVCVYPNNDSSRTNATKL